jgi:hemoglobin/transferrin/lactoferrin receptor protein
MKKLLFIIVGSMVYTIQAQTLTDTLSFDEVDIVTSKFNTPKSKVANKVEVMTKLEISLQNTQSTADLLAGSGQVFVQKSQSGGGSPVIRGFEANKVLIVVDGIRMNNAVFRGGHLQNVIRLDNSMLERADVVFGPGSLIYGSDALGGVLHFQTLKPKLAFNKKVEVSGGALARFASANQEKTGHFDLNIGTKKFASLTAVTFTDYGDVRQGASKNFLAADSLFIWDRKSPWSVSMAKIL